MTDLPPTRLMLAQTRADAARAQLAGTIELLRDRANPQSVAHDVVESIRDRGLTAASSIAATAQRKPVYAGVALAMIGAFIARGRIARLVRKTL